MRIDNTRLVITEYHFSYSPYSSNKLFKIWTALAILKFSFIFGTEIQVWNKDAGVDFTSLKVCGKDILYAHPKIADWWWRGESLGMYVWGGGGECTKSVKFTSVKSIFLRNKRTGEVILKVSSKLEIQCKKRIYFSFSFGWYTIQLTILHLGLLSISPQH